MRSTLCTLFAVGCALLLAACSGQSAAPAGDPYTDVPGHGTEKMVNVLTAINEEAHSRPEFYFYLNSSRAQMLREMLDEAAGEDAVVIRYNYAMELLNAGETERAIEETLALTRELRASPQRMNRGNKPLFDLLGMAYLRLGEEQNCIENPTAESCILPISDAGIHQIREGSEQAAKIYYEMVRHFPRDLTARWLLNIAHMTLGDYPDGVPDRFLISGLAPDVTSAFPRFRDVAMDVGVGHEALAGGVSVEDFNNNGLLDILVTSYGLEDQTRLYMNDGSGGFVDRTEEADLSGLVGGANTVHADFTNNGFADVFILRGAWLGDAGSYPNSLLRNNGDGTFTDVTYEAGVASYHPTQTAAWADFTGNGFVDLFVGNESGTPFDVATGEKDDQAGGTSRRSELYQNNGDGTFTEVSQRVGIDVEEFVKGAAWCDVNNSGLPDLYISVLGGPNRLYINEGGASIDDWRFTEKAEEAGVRDPHYSFTTWCWDMNNDGHEDLFVSGYDARMLAHTASDVAAEYMGGPPKGDLPRIYRNNGDGTFAEVSGPVNLDRVMYTMGANFGDLTGNGYLDFYIGTGAPDLRSLIPNRMFTNRDGRYFEEVTFEGGFGHLQKGHGIAFADFTNSGSPDVYAVMGGAYEGDVAHNVLFENPGHENRWITMRLEGDGSNRSAIGARIRVDVQQANGHEQSIYRTVSTGGSFGATSLQQEIGLGQADHIQRIEVSWPGGSMQVFEDVPVDSHLQVVEGQSELKIEDRPALAFRPAVRAAGSAYHLQHGRSDGQ